MPPPKRWSSGGIRPLVGWSPKPDHFHGPEGSTNLLPLPVGFNGGGVPVRLDPYGAPTPPDQCEAEVHRGAVEQPYPTHGSRRSGGWRVGLGRSIVATGNGQLLGLHVGGDSFCRRESGRTKALAEVAE
jgi:hypothetical protein